MGLCCSRNQRDFRKYYISLGAESNPLVNEISIPADMFQVVGKREIDMAFRDVDKELSKAEARNKGIPLVDELIPLFKKRVSAWVLFSPQENTNNKIHEYYTEQEVPFTPELYFLFKLNASEEVLKTLDNDIDSVETVYSLIGDEMVLTVRCSRCRKKSAIPTRDFFVVSITRRLPSGDVVEFNTSVRFTRLKEQEPFKTMCEDLKSQALVYLAGTRLKRDEKGSLMTSFTYIDFFSPAALDEFKPVLHKKIKDYHSTFLSKMVEFLETSLPDQEYFWFTSDKQDIKRILSENKALIKNKDYKSESFTNTTPVTREPIASYNSRWLDLSISKLSEMLKSGSPEDKSRVKSMVYELIDSLEHNFELKATKVKMNQNLVLNNSQQIQSLSLTNKNDILMGELFEEAKKRADRVKVVMDKLITDDERLKPTKFILKKVLTLLQDKYASYLEEISRNFPLALSTVEEIIPSTVRIPEINERYQRKQTPRELVVTAHTLEAFDDDTLKPGGFNEAKTHSRFNHHLSVDQIEEAEKIVEDLTTDTAIIVGGQDSDYLFLADGIIKQIEEIKTEAEGSKIEAQIRLAQLRNDASVGSNLGTNIVMALADQQDTSEEIDKTITETLVGLEHVRSKLNNSIIGLEKVINEIKARRDSINHIISTNYNRHDELELKRLTIHRKLEDSLELFIELDVSQATLEKQLYMSSVKKGVFIDNKNATEAVLKFDQLHKQRLTHRISDGITALESLAALSLELGNKKANLVQSSEEEETLKIHEENELINVQSRIDKEAKSQHALELEREQLDQQLTVEQVKRDQLLNSLHAIEYEVDVDKVKLMVAGRQLKKELKDHVSELEISMEEVTAQIEEPEEAIRILEEQRADLERRISFLVVEISNEIMVKEEVTARKLDTIDRLDTISGQIDDIEHKIETIKRTTGVLSVQQDSLEGQLEIVDELQISLDDDNTVLNKLIEFENRIWQELNQKKQRVIDKINELEPEKARFILAANNLTMLLSKSKESLDALSLRGQDLDLKKRDLENEQQNLIELRVELDVAWTRFDRNPFDLKTSLSQVDN